MLIAALTEALQLGIIPGGGGTQRAPRLIGLKKAKELIFTGRELTAADAQELGTLSFMPIAVVS